MKTKLCILGPVMVTALCVAAQEVKTHYEKSVDISKAKTFTVMIGASWGNPANEDYAIAVVAQQLTAKGYTEAANPASADMLVVIHGATQDRTSVQSFYNGTGAQNYGWAGPAGVVTTWETEYEVGTGVVDIFDTKAKRLAFRGVAEEQISGIGSQDQKKIEEGVTKMFKDFPRAGS